MNKKKREGRLARACRRWTPASITPLGLLAGLCLVAGCQDEPKPGTSRTKPPEVKGASKKSPLVFESRALDPPFTYDNGETREVNSIVESLGGGVAVIDFDGDSRLDLYFTGGGDFPAERTIVGRPSVMLRNEGDWRFTRATEETGTSAGHFYSYGAATADYDQDGFMDLLVTGYGGMQLLRNQGDGTFLETTEAALLKDELWSTGTAWCDVNGDGSLDLYVAHYVNWSFDNHPDCHSQMSDISEVCTPKVFDPLPDVLFISNGDATFRDASDEYGLRKDGKGLGVLAVDKDNDGDIDIYVTNDTTANFLYVNDGQGRFREVGEMENVALDDGGVPNGSMGVVPLDYNRDGFIDIFVANFEHETFAMYRNDGDAGFLYTSGPTGIRALEGLYVGWGTAAFDFDLDGDEDIVVANGHVFQYTRVGQPAQAPLALAFDPAKERFVRQEYGPDDGYMGKMHRGRGLASGDFDNDGRMDLAVSHLCEPVELLANRSQVGGRSIALRLVGRASNRMAIGARAVLRCSLGELTRQVFGGGSYLSQHDHRLFWGLPKDATIEGLTIHWPSGRRSELAAGEISSQMVLVEPDPPADEAGP